MNTGSSPSVEEQTVAQTDQPETVQEEKKPEFSLQISMDNMTAYLRIKLAFSGQKVSYDDIYEFLKQNNVTYGLCEDAIHSFCDEGRFYSELICAKGIPAVDGTDGWITYHFDTNKKLMPKEREDGTVDFRDLGLVKNISKGDALCTITPPEPGKDGMDIFGHVIPFRPGKLPTLPFGVNTVASSDKLSLLAEVDGCIEYLNSQINVNDVFIVRGNVDSASGNVTANGSVIVQGDVREGFFVKSGQDISVRGMVEGATLEAKGSISLSRGMNGMGRGTLKAGGNIVGKYFENANLISENDIYADVLLNCRAAAGGSVILKGQKASLIGGSCQVGQRILVKNIGTPGSTATRVSIVSKALSSLLVADHENNLETLNHKLAEAQKALDEFTEQYTALTQQIPLNGQPGMERANLLLKASIMKKGQLNEAVQTIKKQISNLQQKTSNLIDFNIIGLGIVYPGTKMSIGPHTTNIQNEYSNTKFYADQERIVSGPVLPSDIV